MFLLLAAVLAITYVKGQQVQVSGYDTAKTGCTYVINPQTFELKSGYLMRVTAYQWDYQPAQGNKQNADSLTLVKVKKPVANSYYLIRDSANKRIWVKVQPIQDFNVDFTLK